MRKHAFLVMAYDDIEFLKILLRALDNSRADIYVHIDKKAKIDIMQVTNLCKLSNVYIIKNTAVTWGSEKQIIVELNLLKESTARQAYEYYHLISGHDFPLVNSKEFYSFFDNHRGMEFIDCREKGLEDILSRIKYYYPAQTLFTGKSILNRVINKIFKSVQKLLGINRIKNKNIKFGFGANWFSITDSLARYVVTQEKFIKKYFYKGICADEMFLQTVWLNSPIFDEYKQFKNTECILNLEPLCRNALRAVDFSQGDGRSPRVFNENDYELLINSGCIFARKLNSIESKKLIKMLLE